MIDPAPITEKDFHLLRLKRAAKVRFDMHADRRAARRKRWELERQYPVIVADFLAGVPLLKLARQHGITLVAAKRIVDSLTTPQQRRARNLARHSEAMRRSSERKNPGMLRNKKTRVAGYPSITEAAKAMGIRPRTLWMRVKRGKALKKLEEIA